MRAHFQHRPGWRGARFRHAKAGIKKAGIMGAKLAYTGIIGAHLGGIFRRHNNKFLASENVKFIRVQHQPPFKEISLGYRFPKTGSGLAGGLVDINQAGMFTRTPSDQTCCFLWHQIYR